MKFSRRDFLRASAAIIAAPGLRPTSAVALQQALAGQGNQPVVWLQGQYCTGDSVSLLNSIHYATVDQLLLNTIDLKYHATTMAAAGSLAVSAAEAARMAGGYVLIVEGAIPIGENGTYCMIWEGMTMQNALLTYSPNAAYVLAVGTCASYGGIPAAAPNPTGATSVSGILGASNKIINIPGCPAHPDWIVGTVAYILANGQAPPLDASRRPTEFYGTLIHDQCHERREFCGQQHVAGQLSESGCLMGLGCKGPQTHADCFSRRNNSAAAGRNGVNWCIGAGSPCIGCVEPSFPDGMSPFLTGS
jgi:hydrogenase small subunit